MHGWRRTLVVLSLRPSVLQGQPLFTLLVRFSEQVLRHEQEILNERNARTIIRVWTVKKLLLTIHKFLHVTSTTSKELTAYGTLQLTRGHNSNSWWSRWIKCIVNCLKTTSRGANLTKNRRNRRIFLKSNMADSSLLQLVLRKSRTCAGRDIAPLKLINCNLFSCGECLLAFLQGIPLLFVCVFLRYFYYFENDRVPIKLYTIFSRFSYCLIF